MDQVKAMKVFVRIYERSSFTLAAEDLNLPRATLTHTLNQFEACAAYARPSTARPITRVACSCWRSWKKPNWRSVRWRPRAACAWTCRAPWRAIS